MFKILICSIIFILTYTVQAEEIVISGSGDNLIAAEQDALHKANLFAQNYIIVKKTNVSPPLTKNWQSNLTLRFASEQYAVVVFTGFAKTKEQARENAVIRCKRFFGDNFKVVDERYQGNLFVVCRLSVERTKNFSQIEIEQGADTDGSNKMKEDRGWSFRDVGRSKQEARANAFRRAILLLGKNIKIVKESYRGGGAFVICRIWVERILRNKRISLSPASGIDWFTGTDLQVQKAYEKAISLAKKLWGNDVAVYGDTRVRLGETWHCTVYVTPLEITERELTIHGVGRSEEQAYSNAQRVLNMMLPIDGKMYVSVKTVYQKIDDNWQCTIISIVE
ncbi:hypothetical protein [Candidatus Uabimicrobium amorphum]|uniref:Uncharacterized protein n=1 Tax=Uabimicrobium amorphum TaxID=2596890 RepID=A0A5S9IQE6_UABAM|nr:hypothetical protein [Candidatus Uabimicrobium amorphum]BBM85994.1 hypothetical protein UABAM_04380 [Candidatus Uabimicrobium amorphum]